VIGLTLASAAPAAAQGGPADAEAPTALAPLASTSPPGPAPTTTATNDKPARGPAVRERGGRRTRGGSAATGALFLVILVGFMGYYVMRKLRR
jgi:hypothetical protein